MELSFDQYLIVSLLIYIALLHTVTYSNKTPEIGKLQEMYENYIEILHARISELENKEDEECEEEEEEYD